MVCINVTSEDSCGHIKIWSCNQRDMYIEAYSDEFIDISSWLYEEPVVSSCDTCEHIDIDSNCYTNICIYSSFVCTINNKPNGYLYLDRNHIIFECDALSIEQIRIFSNVDWVLDEMT